MCGFFPHCNFISTVLSIVFPLLLVRELNFLRLVFPFVFVAILSSKLAVPLQVIDTLASENEAANPRVKIYFGLITATARKAWSKW